MSTLGRVRSWRSWAPLPTIAQSGGLGHILGALVYNFVDHPPLHRHLAGQEIITFERVLDFLQRLAGMLHVDFVQALLEVQDLLGVQHDVRRLPLEAAGWLMEHNPRI